MWGLMIICYFFMSVSLCLITITGLQGYFQFIIFKASHQQFALFSTIFYMFSETLIMFFFIGSGTAIKKEVTQSNIPTSAYNKVKRTKMILFPHLTFNMLLVGVVFILGGAVQTGFISGMVHGVLFIITFFHFLYTILVQHIGFKENVDLVIELANLHETKSLLS